MSKINNKSNQNEKKDEKKFLNIKKNNWGWISVVTNGLSVLFQVTNLYKTKSAQSFSMKFITLMIILNGWYFIVALLEENTGFAIATGLFVLYNLIVVYTYYCGIGGPGSTICL